LPNSLCHAARSAVVFGIHNETDHMLSIEKQLILRELLPLATLKL